MGNKDRYKQLRDVIYYLTKILSWAGFLLLFLISVFLIYYFFESKTYAAKGESHKPKFSLYTIISGSMVPNINVYDVIFDSRVENPKDLKVGDVITFISNNPSTNGYIITHRIVDVGKNEEGYYYHTKGDANQSEDRTPVPFNNVIGKVILKFPQLGRVQMIVSNRLGWILLVLVPALGVIIFDSIKVIKTIKLSNKSKEIIVQKKKEEIKDTSSLKQKLLEKRNNKLKYEELIVKDSDLPKLKE